MQVADSVFARDVLFVATAVARWELGVHFGSRVQRLRNVTDVVDHKSEDERSLIRLVGEVRGDRVRIGGLGSTCLALHELREGFEGTNSVHVRLGEVEIVE